MSRLMDSYLVARATLRTLADSERTEEIHLVEEITGRKMYDRYLRVHASDAETLALLETRPELCDEQVDYEYLRQLPRDTFGSAYIRHLDDNGLTAAAQATPTKYVDDPDMSYLMRRFRQTHDIWHALLDLGTQGHEEVIIHAFSWGQLRLPVSAMVVVGGTIKHLLFERRWGAVRHALLEAYQIGRDAAPLLSVHWETMWSEPLDDVRNRYRMRPCTAQYVHG